jgi:hypothetical protein
VDIFTIVQCETFIRVNVVVVRQITLKLFALTFDGLFAQAGCLDANRCQSTPIRCYESGAGEPARVLKSFRLLYSYLCLLSDKKIDNRFARSEYGTHFKFLFGDLLGGAIRLSLNVLGNSDCLATQGDCLALYSVVAQPTESRSVFQI